MSLKESMSFSLKRHTIPITIEPEDGGPPKPYTLREMDGADRDAFLNNIAGRTKTDSKGQPVGVKNFVGLQANLISRCLFDDAGLAVPEAVVQMFPSKMQTVLFEKCQEMNGLDLTEEQKEALKNG